MKAPTPAKPKCSKLKPDSGGGFRETEPEHHPCCPRCDSTDTKFCYYNNYNHSQPRYFCKSCRRYWTLGGALRNVPVGGGSRRKSNKKPRSLSGKNRNNLDPIINADSTDGKLEVGEIGNSGRISPGRSNGGDLRPVNPYELESGLCFDQALFSWADEDLHGGGLEDAAAAGDFPNCSTWEIGGDLVNFDISWPELAVTAPADSNK